MEKHTYSKCQCGDKRCNQYVMSTQRSVGFDLDVANLYAAAPDLYEVLEDVLSDLDIGAHPYLHIDAIRAALAKARGENQ